MRSPEFRRRIVSSSAQAETRDCEMQKWNMTGMPCFLGVREFLHWQANRKLSSSPSPPHQQSEGLGRAKSPPAPGGLESIPVFGGFPSTNHVLDAARAPDATASTSGQPLDLESRTSPGRVPGFSRLPRPYPYLNQKPGNIPTAWIWVRIAQFQICPRPLQLGTYSTSRGHGAPSGEEPIEATPSEFGLSSRAPEDHP